MLNETHHEPVLALAQQVAEALHQSGPLEAHPRDELGHTETTAHRWVLCPTAVQLHAHSCTGIAEGGRARNPLKWLGASTP